MEINVPVTDDLIKFDEESAMKKDMELAGKKPGSVEPTHKKSDEQIEPIVPALRKPMPEEQQPNRERNPVTGSGVRSDLRRTKGNSFTPNHGIRSGNPITWEGYGDERPGTAGTQNSVENGTNARNKGRVPPGGFSSGLW